MESFDRTIPRKVMLRLDLHSLRLPPDTTIWQAMLRLLILSIVAFIGYWLCLVFYRLFLHPLRNVPGPRIAAATGWYEFYQDVILDGHYMKEYPAMHEKYGGLI